MKTILIQHNDGTVAKAEVPDNARFTFGPLIPGPSANGGTLYLRVYITKENQLAVFPGVVSFRDDSVKVYHVDQANEDGVTWKEVNDQQIVGEQVLKRMRERY